MTNLRQSPETPGDPPRPRVEGAGERRAVANRTVENGDTSLPPDPVPPQSGLPFGKLPTEFGRYRVEKLLGAGAMGAVYLATDSQLDRQVAIKVPKLSKSGSAALLGRMEREAKALAQLDHSNLCKIYDFNVIDGVRFIALEYVQGETLKSLLQRLGRKRKVSDAVAMTVQLARALGAAHEKGVVHRDLKPENVMRRPDGRLVIMDFGLNNRQSQLGEEAAHRTQQGTILGTPAYMSPEQAAGRLEEVDQRSDIYALGVMLYEMLTGELPFSGTAMEIMGRKTIQPAPSPLSVNPKLPPELAGICDRMLAQKAENRIATCPEIVKALKACDLTARAVVADPSGTLAAPSNETGDLFDFLRDPESVDASSKKAPADLPPPRPKTASDGNSWITGAAGWWRSQPLSMRFSLVGAAAVVLAIAGMIFLQTDHGPLPVDGGDPALSLRAAVPPSDPRDGPPEPRPTKDLAAAPGGRPTSSDDADLSGNEPGEQREFSDLKIKMRWCPPGTFRMGIGEPLAPSQNDGKPFRTVTFTDGFWLGGTEVTQAEWEAVMQTHPWRGAHNAIDGLNVAATYVTGNDAVRFCDLLTQREQDAKRLPPDWRYVLPTEAQWEYACRAGTETRFFFGDSDQQVNDYAWSGGPQGNTANEPHAHPVAQKRPNAWGLYDMAGNVSEWCSDRILQRSGAEGSANQELQALRGGAWASASPLLGAGRRGEHDPAKASSLMGLRVALLRGRGPAAPALASQTGTIAAGTDRPESAAGASDPIPIQVVDAGWRLQEGELRSIPGPRQGSVFFGDRNWSDYDLRYEFQLQDNGSQTSGRLLSRFHSQLDEKSGRLLILSGRNNGTVWLANKTGDTLVFANVVSARIASGDWQTLEIQIRGPTADVLLNGDKIIQGSRFHLARGCLQLGYDVETDVRIRNLTVRSPEGRMLWEGLEALGAASAGVAAADEKPSPGMPAPEPDGETPPDAKSKKPAPAKTAAKPKAADQKLPKTFTTTASGLRYRILRAGNGVRPTAASRIEVHYRGRLENGVVFDDSYARNQTMTFPVRSIIPGWAEGMQLIDEGGMIELQIPANLGYGAKGVPPAIPPNANLFFVVELIKVL